MGTTNEGDFLTTFDAHGDFIESANTISANPLPVSVDVSCVAANQDWSSFVSRTAKRLRRAGFSHYFWGIDDVTVSSNQVMNDVEVTQIVNGDVFNVFEYRVTPLEQAILDSEGGLLAGVMYKNVGTVNQTNVEALVEVLDESGVVLNTTTEIDTVLTHANALTCPANTQDTLYLATGWSPTPPARTACITWTGDSADATPENNTLFKNILYTDDIYGHDDENVLDGELDHGRTTTSKGTLTPPDTAPTSTAPTPARWLTAWRRSAPTAVWTSTATSVNWNLRRLVLLRRAGLTDSPFDANYWLYDVEWSTGRHERL